jgi:RNA-directed DNA polymerase
MRRVTLAPVFAGVVVAQRETRWGRPPLRPMPASYIIRAVAQSLLGGEPESEAAAERLRRMLNPSPRWIPRVAARYAAAFEGKTRPRMRDVVEFLRSVRGFQQTLSGGPADDGIAQPHWAVVSDPAPADFMQPVPAAKSWGLPQLVTLSGLAEWLGVSFAALDWFADLKELSNKSGNTKLQHYNYSVRAKRSGGVRLIEMPKSRLKAMQRKILAGILQRIPVHDAAHGFVKDRSIVTFARPHAGQRVVLRLDLADFFPTFRAARVEALFRTLGYPEAVADRLAGICTNATPLSLWKTRPVEIAAAEWGAARHLYVRPHLPQGAPTSPALANLMAYRLDCRLTGLASSAGAVYTRYADDLAFSGGEDFRRVVHRFSLHVAAVALEEQFHVRHQKTRIMSDGARQELAGVVVNREPSLRRRELETLEAVLTNCARRGPADQNREGLPDFRAHLEGRVGFIAMVNAEKGARLRRIFDSIRW